MNVNLDFRYGKVELGFVSTFVDLLLQIQSTLKGIDLKPRTLWQRKI